MQAGTERFLPSGECIISKTDLKGNITYANQPFIDVSGYNQQELLNQAHSIIRHPDMPKAVFRMLWDSIKRGYEFVGFVKNRCKNGDYYWVFATVSPSYGADGKIQSYISVRRPANTAALPLIKRLYQEMLDLEKGQTPSTSWQASTQHLQDILDREGMSYNEWAFKHQTG